MALSSFIFILSHKTPLGRQEKLLLEQKNRVISGFSIDKTWNDKVLHEKVKAQFPDDCRNIDFEFVKNCYGALVKPTLAPTITMSLITKSLLGLPGVEDVKPLLLDTVRGTALEPEAELDKVGKRERN
jgi:hypothetical protein